MSAIATFFGVLFALLFVAAVTSNGALKGPDAFALRWTVISLALALSALAAWLRVKVSRPAARPSRANPQPVATPAQPVAARATTPPPPLAAAPPATAQIDADVERASRQAIVFRQHFPPRRGESERSFFGGAPIAPTGFTWPRPKDGNGRPFSFLMQIDCAAVPASGRRGLLPDRGVLYFFLDLVWGQTDAFRVVYADAQDAERWTVVLPPGDLGPAFGEEGAWLWKWPQSLEDCPKLLPKWTFDPVVIDIPARPREPEEDEVGPALWPGEKATAEILRAAQGQDVGNWFTIKDFTVKDGSLARPFAEYPHDWRAIQICSGRMAERLRHDFGLAGTSVYREQTEEQREPLRQRIRDEALTWYARASVSEPFAVVPQVEKDQFWSWLQTYSWLARFVIIEAVTDSIEASLVQSAESAARIPPDVVRRVHHRHALAVRTDNGIHANTPHRMLAPPVDVQGNQWDRAKTHLLLLEISSNEGLGHHFGEGVIQFWISPADLKARRFEKVELTADAY